MVVKFLFILLASCISLIAGFVLSRRYRFMTKPFAVIGFFLLGFSVLPRVFPAYLYYLFPPYFFLEVMLAFAFLLTGVLAARYSDTIFRGLLQGILFLLMVYYILFPPCYLALYGDGIKNMNFKIRDGVTLQSSYFGCVPSSIATVLRTYGLEYTEGELAYALHTTTMGTDYSRIPRVVKTFGKARHLRARFIRADLNELRRLDQPGVLYIFSGRIRHATAFLGFEKGDVILGDPLYGIRRIKINEFQNITHWTGLATIISEESI